MSSWNLPNDDTPRLGRRGLIWFRRNIRQGIRALLVGDGVTMDDDGAKLLEAMVDWYAARADEFAHWHENAAYHGPGFSCGQWRLTSAVGARYDEAYNAVCDSVGFVPVEHPASPHAMPELKNKPIPDGPIDIDAALQELAMPTRRAAEEPSAYLVIRDHRSEEYRRFSEQRRRYKSNMPRTCQSCGETFVAGHPGGAAACRACKAAKRKRCCKCGDVFSAKSNKEKRRESCLVKAAQAGEVSAAEILQRRQSNIDGGIR